LSTEEPVDVKILPANQYVIKIIVLDTHHRRLHARINHTLTEQIWILQERRDVWNILSKCVECHRLQGPCIRQTIAPLPSVRCSQSLAFELVGIDFAGPLFNCFNNTTKETKKVYICLITCAVTRAIHLELVQLLTTYYFILVSYLEEVSVVSYTPTTLRPLMMSSNKCGGIYEIQKWRRTWVWTGST